MAHFSIGLPTVGIKLLSHARMLSLFVALLNSIPTYLLNLKYCCQCYMRNIARGGAECYISIEAECQVLYFTYSTRRGDALTYRTSSTVYAHHETSNFYHLFRKRYLSLSFSSVLLPFPSVKHSFGSFFLFLYALNYVFPFYIALHAMLCI